MNFWLCALATANSKGYTTASCHNRRNVMLPKHFDNRHVGKEINNNKKNIAPPPKKITKLEMLQSKPVF